MQTAPLNLRGSESLTAPRVTGTAAADLGQQDFLRLMTAQLQNQDPFAPMENGEFLAQMAQFSTVSGLENVNATLSSISGQIAGNRISTGASLLGQHVLVPGTMARPDDAGQIHGQVRLDQSTAGLTVRYLDAASGLELARQDLGAQAAGPVDFSWTDIPPAVTAARSALRVTVTAEGPAGPATVAPWVYARVTGVEMPGDGTDINLRVEDYGIRNSLEVGALR
jgi:flagellar basal-body rod modification protein FlgD